MSFLGNIQSSFEKWATDAINARTYRGGTQEFLASGTFTVPSGVTAVYLTGIGGGGGGGGVSSATGSRAAGGGGSGQYCVRKKVTVTPGASIAVTIGTAGTGGTAAGANGTNGGATSFGALLTLPGGSGAITRTDTNASAISIGGYPNGQNSGFSSSGQVGGSGGMGPFGAGGAGASSAGNGSPAAANTGAGGGGGNGVTSTASGGAGGTGYLLVEW